MVTQRCIGIASLALAGSVASAAPQDIQISRVLTQEKTITLINKGDEPVSLDGWRFCTQNSTQIRVYTTPGGLDGITIEPLEQISIRLQNDASPNIPNHFNGSDIGSFANFENDAYALALYFPDANGSVPFADGHFMADFIQWSLDGIDNTTADERSDEAEEGGLWTDQSVWIATKPNTGLIEQHYADQAEPSGPSEYSALYYCAHDLIPDGMLDFHDISAFLSLYYKNSLVIDFTNDGVINFFDISAWISLYHGGC